MRRVAGPLGLLGRIVAILLLALLVEFAASTFLYERASRFSLREDEARRLAEHLVIAHRVLETRGWRERPATAATLSTDRYDVRWTPLPPRRAPIAPEMDEMRRQIEAWEPDLGRSGLDVHLASPGRRSRVEGSLRLSDRSWLAFATHEPVPAWDLAAGRIVLALVPAITLLILGGLLIRRTLRPLRALAAATAEVGLGREVAVREQGTSEVRLVIRAFNEMQGRIHRLIEDRTQALAAVGHDLRTPLARLRLRLDGLADAPARRAMAADVGEMAAMVASLLAFLGGEDDPEQPVRIDLAVLAATLADDAADRGADAAYAGPDHLEARVRASAMRRALANLVENALHYGDRARIVLEPRGDAILLAVEDDGPGIPPDRIGDVLRPFTRLDAARARNTRGLGLGLAIVARAVAREGGTLGFVNRAGGGLRVEILLPAAAGGATFPYASAGPA